MSIKNTSTTYGSIAKTFHWGSALLYVGLFAVAYYMMAMPSGDAKWEYYALHKSFGVLVLLIAIVRFFWRMMNTTPVEPGLSSLLKLASHAVHYAIYALIIAMPLSGYIMSTAGGHNVMFFGWELPALLAKDPELAKSARLAHTYISYAIIFFVSAHILAALWHHFIKKDNVLKRMLPGSR